VARRPRRSGARAGGRTLTWRAGAVDSAGDGRRANHRDCPWLAAACGARSSGRRSGVDGPVHRDGCFAGPTSSTSFWPTRVVPHNALRFSCRRIFRRRHGSERIVLSPGAQTKWLPLKRARRPAANAGYAARSLERERRAAATRGPPLRQLRGAPGPPPRCGAARTPVKHQERSARGPCALECLGLPGRGLRCAPATIPSAAQAATPMVPRDIRNRAFDHQSSVVRAA
jgi:hypothetical protein